MISESTNRAGTACYDWQVRAMDRAAQSLRRMMADADAHQLARGRHQFTDASGLIERENGL